MNRIFSALISVLCFVVVLPAMAESDSIQIQTPKPTPNRIQKITMDKPIIVRSATPAVTVALPANKTTGYSWFLLGYNPNMVVPVSHRYVAPASNEVGAPGVSYWTFRVRENAFIVPTATRIKLIYGRPWDMSHAKTRVVTLITH